LDHLDEVIDLIRRSRSADTAKSNLMDKFKLTEIQAQAILDMQLRRLAALERKKIQDEYKEKLALIKDLEKLLARPELMRQQVKNELQEVSGRFGDKRRTQIVSATGDGAVSTTGLLPDSQVWVMIGEKGTVGRTNSRSIPQMSRKPAEQPAALLRASTRDTIYLVSSSGKAVGLPVHRVSEGEEMGEGSPWADLTPLGRTDHLAAAFVLPAESSIEGYLFLTTLAGVVKRVRLSDLPGVTSDPFTIINVAEDDALGWARITLGNQEVFLATSSGQAIRFGEEAVRPMGLPAAGVLGIKLDSDTDGVIGMDIVSEETLVWSITDNGLAKATPIEDYPLQNRYGQGVINMRLPKGSSEVAAMAILNKRSTLIVTTSNGVVKKVGLSDTIIGSRSVRPQPALSLAARSRVTGAVLPHEIDLLTHSASTPEKAKTRHRNRQAK
jgi:DNA gyrase subunit A